MQTSLSDGFETIFLRSDNGAETQFVGRLFSESAYYDEEHDMLTRMRLFVTNDGRQVFSIISGAGQKRQRRYYIVEPQGAMYGVSDGLQKITLTPEMLFAAVFGLCGIDPDMAEEIRPAFEEALQAVG